MHDRTDMRVHVDRKNTGDIVARGDGFYGCSYVNHAITKILSAVGRDADNFSTTKPGLQRRKVMNERRILGNSL